MRGRPITITDEALLDAARDVLLERGAGASTADIAERAEISESVLFHRFKSKDELLAAVIERQWEIPPVLETLAQRVGEGDIAAHLFEVGLGILEATKKAMPFFMLARSGSWKLDAFRERMRRPHPSQIQVLRLLSGYFDAEIDGGRLRQVDSEILARLFVGGVLQFVMTQCCFDGAERRSLPFPTYMRGLADLLLHGAAKKAR